MKKVTQEEMLEAMTILFAPRAVPLPVLLQNALSDVINTGSARRWATAKLNWEIYQAAQAERLEVVIP